MVAMRANAGQGWGWIAEGWRLFLKAPGIWVVIFLIYMAISIVLSLIPFVGMIAQTLLNPVLIGGLMYGVARLAQGDKLEIGHLFRGFQDQEKLGSLVMLGLVSIAGGVLILLVFIIFLGGGLITGAALEHTGTHAASEAIGGLFVGAGLIMALIVLIVGVLISMALFYSIPLVMLGRQNAWPAIQDSVMACWLNIVPLLIFGLIFMVLAFIAFIPFGLGMLVLLPVAFCAVYSSYQEVFEHGGSSGEGSSGIDLAK